MKSLGIVICVALVSAFAGTVYKYESDMAAWHRVEEALIRLQSGIRYESIFQLRPRLADADAAIKSYQATQRFFPLHHVRRADIAEVGISDVDSALSWQVAEAGKQSSAVDSSNVRALNISGNLATFFQRFCSDGTLLILNSDISAGLVSEGNELLSVALRETRLDFPIGKFPKLNATFEEEGCWQAEAEAKRQEQVRQQNSERQYWAQFRYRVTLSIASSSKSDCTFYLGVDGAGDSSEELHPGQTREYGADTQMGIDLAQCSNSARPADVIRVSLNGRPYQPKWGIRMATILPEAK